MAAAVPDNREELAEAVATLNVQPKRPQHKKTAAKGPQHKKTATKGGKQEPGKALPRPQEVRRPSVEVCRPPYLHTVRKRVGPAAAAAAPMGNPSCLLYLVDVASSKRYLVDSGSAYSILPSFS